MRKIAAAICMISILTASAAFAGAGDTEVTIEPPLSHKTRKILLFPLNVPSYVLRVATIPIGASFDYLEKKQVIGKTMDLLSNKERTFWVYPVIEGGGGGSFGGGVGLKHSDLFHKNYLLGAVYKTHINMNQTASFSFGKLEAFTIGGQPVSYSTGADWNHLNQVDYFGIGNDSSNQNQTDYGIDNIRASATFSYIPFKNFSVSPHVGIDAGKATNNRYGSSPNVDQLFPASETVGYQQWLDYVNVGLLVSNDTRNRLDYPEKGGLRSFTFQHFSCLNQENYNYNQYILDVRQYFPVLKSRQTLLLRTAWKFEQTFGDNAVPFWRLSSLGAPSFLRGFVTGRFHDKNYALANVEYRFPLWELFGGVLFYDVGRVFHSMSSFSLGGLKNSGGGGLHFRVPKIALMRFEAAYGGEGINVMFGTSKPL